MSGGETRGQVIVFKAPTDSEKEQTDIYYETLTGGGFDVIKIPVLDFEFFNLSELREKLSKPCDYTGIIFSSPRCVKACVSAARIGSDVLLEKWKSHRNYAVGETTAKMAEDAGLNVLGRESGNANALADIMATCEYDKPFLYPIGSLTNDNFKLKLKESNIEVDDIVIYQTKSHPDLEKNITEMLQKIVHPVYFLYFSPSGVNFTLPILREKGVHLDDVKFVAIGPTTEKGLKEHGLNVYRTVAKPTPVATLEALKS